MPRVRDHSSAPHVCEVAGDDLPQPLALVGDWLVHPLPQFLLYLLELGSHAVAAGFPLEKEVPPS
jgi:hypothetical protein